MYKLVFAFALVAVAAAAPQVGKAYRPVAEVRDGRIIGIVKQASDVNPDGSYQYNYETENGIAYQESGAVKNVGQKEAAMEVRGQFQYTAPDGTPYAITYVADENGFQPQGAHLPVAPEVPAQIARALQYIAAHPYVEDKVVSISGTRKY